MFVCRGVWDDGPWIGVSNYTMRGALIRSAMELPAKMRDDSELYLIPIQVRFFFPDGLHKIDGPAKWYDIPHLTYRTSNPPLSLIENGQTLIGSAA